MPLIPEDFFSSDGATRDSALTTNQHLRTHGKRIKNCLRYSSVRGVARQGAIGTVFILGLYDAQSDKPLSTVEIRIARNCGTGEYRFITRQHTAMRNRKPSRQCHEALQELLL